MMKSSNHCHVNSLWIQYDILGRQRGFELLIGGPLIKYFGGGTTMMPVAISNSLARDAIKIMHPVV